MIQTLPIFPSAKVSDIVVEPYNTLLGLSRQVEHVNLCHVIENDALHSICQKKLRIKTPTYREINAIVSELICGITCGSRFPGQINSSLRKLAVNLVPFPRLHFLMNYLAPLAPPADNTTKNNPAELLNRLFSP